MMGGVYDYGEIVLTTQQRKNLRRFVMVVYDFNALFTTLFARNILHRFGAKLLYRHAFCQISWFVYIGPPCTGGVVRQKLQWHHVQ